MTGAIDSLLSSLSPLAVLFSVMGIVFVETGLLFGFILPGDSLLFTAGVYVASGVVSLPFWLLATGIFVAAVAGDQLGYLIGRGFGSVVFQRPESRLFSRRRVQQAEKFFAKHGPKAVVLARFIPIIRTFTPVVAGVARMSYRRFLTFNVFGAFLWAVGVMTAGYYLGGVAVVHNNVEIVTLAVIGLSLLPAAVEFLRHRQPQDQPDITTDTASELADPIGR